jgi:hypothetical protein
MGQVLTATDPDIERRVAIKILRPDIESHRSHLTRFKNEFKLTGQLEHPNIVPVHETGRTDDGRIYFCMKWVQGETLAQLLKEQRNLAARRGGAIDPTPFLKHLLRVCDALSFAHSREIVHRDLKPANLMVGAFGEVLVMDWGLAREIRANEVVHEEGSPGPASEIPHDPSQTVEGAILGTLAYMAPEQARGERTEIDAQTDIYALGAILYNIVTGFPPQTDGSTKEILDRVRRGEFVRPSVRAPDASIPAELEAVVMKAMAAKKRDRYPDAKAFQAEIQAYLDGRVLEAAHYNPLQLLAKWVVRNRKMCTGAAAVFFSRSFFSGFCAGNRSSIESESGKRSNEPWTNGSTPSGVRRFAFSREWGTSRSSPGRPPRSIRKPAPNAGRPPRVGSSASRPSRPTSGPHAIWRGLS